MAICYIEISENFLLSVSYWDSFLTVFRIESDGRLTQTHCYEEFAMKTELLPENHHDELRQNEPHFHCIVKNNQRNDIFYVADLGSNSIRIFKLSEFGTIKQVKEIVHPVRMTGPRFLRCKEGKIYVANELNSTLSVFDVTENGENLKLVSDKELFPGLEVGSTFAANIEIIGNKIYISNRGDNTISVFDQLTEKYLQKIPTLGKIPRSFAINANFLLIANEATDSIVSFKKTGDDYEFVDKINLPGPNFICFQ